MENKPMTKKFKNNIMYGVGSIMNILPQTDYRALVPKKTTEERIRESWERVGKSIESSIGKITCEQEDKQ